ncbi:MAG TPA: efflux RND transporter periplasmic adaptor subunit [Fimbriimonadaceae bacterium]|nr:efflux RND transporter periplasmic adaptor subunit [Fimbriimonadaceae bacterium]
MKARQTIAVVLATLAVLTAVFLVGSLPQRPLEVRAKTVRTGSISLSFSAEGFVRGKDYALAPEMSGLVEWIGVREGDEVRPGQVLLRLENTDRRNAIRQAEIAYRAADIQRREAQTRLSITRQSVASREAQARAALRGAEAALARVKRGAKPEEIGQAQHRVEGETASVADCQAKLNRAERLYAEGAISRSQYESARVAYETAQASLEAARDALALLERGPLPEEVVAAEANVEQARSQLTASLQARLEIEVAQSQIRLAEARALEARDARDSTVDSLRHWEIKAPVAGQVTRVLAEPGSMAGPTSTAIIVSTREDLHVEAEIGSEDAAIAAKGMRITVTSAAYPGTRFPGFIERIAPVGELNPNAAIRTRIVRARVQIDEGWDRFRPGVEVDVLGERRRDPAILVPNEAILTDGGQNRVFVVQGGVAHVQEVRLGYPGLTETEVLEGLAVGEMVAVSETGVLREGVSVRIRP